MIMVSYLLGCMCSSSRTLKAPTAKAGARILDFFEIHEYGRLKPVKPPQSEFFNILYYFSAIKQKKIKIGNAK